MLHVHVNECNYISYCSSDQCGGEEGWGGGSSGRIMCCVKEQCVNNKQHRFCTDAKQKSIGDSKKMASEVQRARACLV